MEIFAGPLQCAGPPFVPLANSSHFGGEVTDSDSTRAGMCPAPTFPQSPLLRSVLHGGLTKYIRIPQHDERMDDIPDFGR
ncbi:hypothetical protein ZHAS_00010981 [Anopheles sinensis]|uniref:Uncharacterized protein n=1 Tax=Anopheles sinensis TaxID=74873 RepID=A0A084VZ09_ANOSI|nr:hypothetical protein ZHAS_00010981 [Anopheles sinensis]